MDHLEEDSSKYSDPSVDRTRHYLNEIAMDGLLHEALRFMVNRHVDQFGLSPADGEELQQGIWLEFAKAFKKFDPSRSAPSTFARGVADLWLRQQGRALRAKRRKRVFDAENWTLEDANARSAPDAGAAEDARHDFESICTLLEPEDAELLSEFAHYTMIEIAQRRGINRGTVHRRIARIYDYLRARVEYFEK